MADEDVASHPPSSIVAMRWSSQGRIVDALRPACANWIPIFTFCECAKSITSLKLFACASSSIEGQPIEMRPSGITPVASTMIRPGAPVAKAPR